MQNRSLLSYDYAGNILTISLNNALQQTFAYNASNELVRVDDAAANKSVTYEYDYVGNITSVKTYSYTTGTLGTPLTTQNYTYNSQNQRTDLSYDSYGNLTACNGYSLGWNDRRLTSAISNDNIISYTYNSSGIRTSKTVNGTTTYYEVDENNNVVKQYNLVNNEETNVIEFVYDSSNAPIYLTYNNSTYYYEKNLQGDIVGVIDGQGDSIVQYTYDIWGKLLSVTGTLASTIGEINPLRYRGYYYDTETALYYLQSRYYSPDLMRFISQDDVELSNVQGEALGSNLYSYCYNNCVNTSDPTGMTPFKAIGLQLVINVGSLTVGLEALWSTSNWKFYLFGFVGGSRSFNIRSLTQTENALMEDVMYLMRSVKKFSISNFSIFKKFKISVSFVAVLGNRYASFPKDYCGWFSGVSLTFWHVTVSGSIGYSGKAKIGSLGLGISSSKASVGFGQTFYFQLTGNNAFKNSLSALKNGIMNKLEVLKLFACFF